MFWYQSCSVERSPNGHRNSMRFSYNFARHKSSHTKLIFRRQNYLDFSQIVAPLRHDYLTIVYYNYGLNILEHKSCKENDLELIIKGQFRIWFLSINLVVYTNWKRLFRNLKVIWSTPVTPRKTFLTYRKSDMFGKVVSRFDLLITRTLSHPSVRVYLIITSLPPFNSARQNY